MNDKIKEIYAVFSSSDSGNKSFAENFAWMFGEGIGKRTGSYTSAAEFFEKIKAEIIDITDRGDRESAYDTAKFIMEQSTNPEKYQNPECIASASALVIDLVPLLNPDKKAKLLSLLEKLPKKYFFDGQKKLKKALSK